MRKLIVFSVQHRVNGGRRNQRECILDDNKLAKNIPEFMRIVSIVAWHLAHSKADQIVFIKLWT